MKKSSGRPETFCLMFGLFFTRLTNIIAEEQQSLTHDGNGNALVRSMRAKKQACVRLKRSVTVNIFANRLIITSVGTAHNKIRRNNGVRLDGFAKLRNNTKGSCIGR